MNYDITTLCLHSRRRGNTYWMLQAAIQNPNVCIIARDERHAADLSRTYLSMLKGRPWHVKLKEWYLKKFKRTEPVRPTFIGVHKAEGYLRAKNIPVTFDLGTLLLS